MRERVSSCPVGKHANVFCRFEKKKMKQGLELLVIFLLLFNVKKCARHNGFKLRSSNNARSMRFNKAV